MAAPRSFKQELVGVFGHPVAENPTQAMIEPAFADLGLDWRYLTVEVLPEHLADAVHGAHAMGWRGFNCTIPHKVAVVEHLHYLTEAAETIGAVNCVVIRHGELIGDNTDGKGFLQSVQSVRPIEGLRVAILGAGGAARAVGVELALAGAAHLTVVNRSPDRGESLARTIRERTAVPADFVPWQGDYRVPEGTDLVVNATSIGLYSDKDILFRGIESALADAAKKHHPDAEIQVRIDRETGRISTTAAGRPIDPPESGKVAAQAAKQVVIRKVREHLYVEDRVPLDIETLTPSMVVADVIPNPPRTRLIRDAEARGCTVLDGLGMLVNQGVIGIKLWTGRDARPEVMRRALEEVFRI